MNKLELIKALNHADGLSKTETGEVGTLFFNEMAYVLEKRPFLKPDSELKEGVDR